MKRIVLLALVAVVFIGCQDGTSPTEGGFETANFVIFDGAHGGNADVFFLPPLVPDPSGDGEFGDREANPDLERGIVARICDTDGHNCFDDLAMEFQEVGGFYRANWRTRGLGLANNTVQRITIVLGSVDPPIELAVRDVTPVKKAKGSCKSGDTCDFNNGSTLPIKVRIETGAGCIALGFEGDPDDCAFATLDKDETVELPGVATATPTNKGGTLNIQPCPDLRDDVARPAAMDGRVDLRTFGPCIEIIPLDPDLSGIATLCDAFGLATAAGSSDEQAGRMTVHRFSPDAEAPEPFTVALAHAAGPDCVSEEPPPQGGLGLNRLERFVRFARNTWRAVSDQVRAWIEPAPLWAKMAVRCNRGGCSGPGVFRSHYQVALPAWMDAPNGTDLGTHLAGTVVTAKVRVRDSGELGPTDTPAPELVNDVRLTVTVTSPTGEVSAPEIFSGEITDGIAQFDLTVGVGLNTIEVTGIGVGTDGLPNLNVFGPSINATGATATDSVELAVGTLTFRATGFQYTIEQSGLASTVVKPLVGTQSVEDFYAYGTLSSPSNASSNTGLEEDDTSILFLYEDASGNVSLVMIHDKASGIGTGSGGKVIFGFTGVPGSPTSFRVSDDGGETGTTTSTWQWNNDNTDGGALGFLNADFTITIAPDFVPDDDPEDEDVPGLTPGDIDSWKWLTGSGTLLSPTEVPLNLTQTITIVRSSGS